MSFPTLNTKTILVVGDVMLDGYYWCDVERISPEAPVPVCKLSKTSYVPGGAGNVARNIASLGAKPILIGLCGNDEAASLLKKTLELAQVSSEYLYSNNSLKTTKKTRIIAQKQQMLRLDEEGKSSLTKMCVDRLKERVLACIGNCDAVVLSDYGKQIGDATFCQWLVQTSKAHQKPILVDPKGNDYKKYAGATLIKPNFKEFQEAVGCHITTENDFSRLAFELKRQLEIEALLVTRSEKGMVLLSKDIREDIYTKAQDVIDVSGAGDTVIATLAWAYSNAVSKQLAAVYANIAAGIVVSKLGTADVSYEELKRMVLKQGTNCHSVQDLT